MKQWKCPACGNLTDYVNSNVIGTCSRDINGDTKMVEWEEGYGVCEDCGFTENYVDTFELVDVDYDN